MKSSRWVELAVLCAMLVGPLFVYPIMMAHLACMALLACSLNLLFGYAGLLSFGHAAFFGVAAYASGVALKEWGFTPELAILLATAIAAVVGAIFGSLATRRSGIYFSMITLALAQLVFFLAVKAPFTNNEDGYQGVPRGRLFGVLDLKSDLAMYYFVLAVVVLAWLGMRRLIASPFGEALEGIRENEDRALSLGYSVRTFKVMVFTMSAALAGLAGALKTLVFGIAALSDVHWHVSADAIIMTVLGGMGTMLGPVVGAGVLVAVSEVFDGELSTLVPFVLGAIFIVAVSFFRRGVAGELIHALETRKKGGSPATSTAPVVSEDQPAKERPAAFPESRS
jgi:branched-chain amino acid transport system permease protein